MCKNRKKLLILIYFFLLVLNKKPNGFSDYEQVQMSNTFYRFLQAIIYLALSLKYLLFLQKSNECESI